VDTITVAADRISPSHTPEMAVLIGIALVILAGVWMMRSKRHRQPPHA
jgi:hypothetical protein